MILNMLAIAVLATSAPHVAAPTTPHAIVQSLYRPYLKNAADTGSAEDAIRPFATKSLKHLIDADAACMKREQGICNIDFDILIAGQDWDVSHFSIIEDAASTQAQVVHVRFDSGGPVEVRFYFVHEAGVWKIDDVEDLRPKDDPIRRDIRLKKQLLGQS